MKPYYQDKWVTILLYLWSVLICISGGIFFVLKIYNPLSITLITLSFITAFLMGYFISKKEGDK